MAYKAIKLIECIPDPTLTSLQNAQARKFHYESEIARVEAARLIHLCKEEDIKVQGNQNV